MNGNSNIGSFGVDDDAFNLFDYPNLTGTPERRLLAAILERAVLDYVGNEQKEVTEAQEWIFEDLDNQAPEPFSFPWICRELDLNIPQIAQKIRHMPKRGDRRIAPWYFDKDSCEKEQCARRA